MNRLEGTFGTPPRWTWRQFIGQSFAGCWVVALLTFSGWVLHFNPACVGFLFLLAVVCMAIVCGFWQATIVSVLACACLDYFFYPPLLTFNINDPQDWVALGAFEISALVVSRVSTREHRSTREAVVQRTAMEQLYELSRSTLLINLHQSPGPQLIELIHRIFHVDAVAIFDANTGKSDRAGLWGFDELELARETFMLNAEAEDRLTATTRKLLRAGDKPVGAIAIRGAVSPLVADALASLCAMALDRFLSFEKESSIEAERQSEKLRAGVLDSLGHAVKTPLTAIRTANEGLSRIGELNHAQTELTTLIDTEASQLSQLCARLLQTARLEEEVSLGKEDISVSDLVANALHRQGGRLEGHPVQISVSDPDLTVRGDADLLEMALTQYIDNAAKYSFSNTPIEVTARESHSEVLISVHNFGPTIPIADRERIFQRFYRSEAAKQQAEGTGIGLSTVRMAADVHHGHAWVISDAEEGTSFYLSLPQSGRKSP